MHMAKYKSQSCCERFRPGNMEKLFNVAFFADDILNKHSNVMHMAKYTSPTCCTDESDRSGPQRANCSTFSPLI